MDAATAWSIIVLATLAVFIVGGVAAMVIGHVIITIGRAIMHDD